MSDYQLENQEVKGVRIKDARNGTVHVLPGSVQRVAIDDLGGRLFEETYHGLLTKDGSLVLDPKTIGACARHRTLLSAGATIICPECAERVGKACCTRAIDGVLVCTRCWWKRTLWKLLGTVFRLP